jgi:hypothetical protein
MRRQTKWVFAFLAVVFAGSFVFLGVGSGGSALTDFLNGNIHLFGSSGGPSIKSLQSKVAKHPTDPKLRLQLAQALGKQSTKDSNFDPAIAAYGKYLKMKPRDESAMNELAQVYGNKVAALQTSVQSPPTPPLTAINAVSPIASNTTLGTALATLQPIELGQTALQSGETTQLNKLLGDTINAHVGIYKQIAALTPDDSTAFLAAAQIAGKDNDVKLQISLDQQFVKKYPDDPLVPQIKIQLKTLKKQLTSGQTSTGQTTTPGTTSPTG